MARVFLWKPHRTYVGHLSLRLDDNVNDKRKTYISFWPDNSAKWKHVLTGTRSVDHSYDDDYHSEGNRHPDDYFDIPQHLISLPAIRTWWKENKKKTYSLLGYNCAQCVYDALKAGGLELFHMDWVRGAGAHIHFPDDDDDDWETMEARMNYTPEAYPTAPATAFTWIKDAVNKKSNYKCVIL